MTVTPAFDATAESKITTFSRPHSFALLMHVKFYVKNQRDPSNKILGLTCVEIYAESEA